MKYKIFAILFTLQFFANCQGKKPEIDLSQSKRLVTFVEARSASDGLGSGGYGDIKILDLDSYKSMNVTDDKFYDRYPKWSRDGRSILFQSNRFDESTSLSIKGIDGPYDVCLLQLVNRSLKRISITHQPERPEYLRSDLIDLQWYSDGCRLLFYYAGGKRILITDSSYSKIHIFADFSQYGVILKFVLSPDGQCIVFEYKPFENTYDGSGIAIYNLKNKQFIRISDEGSLGDWMEGSDQFLYERGDSVFVYDMVKSSSLFQFSSPNNLIISECSFASKAEIVFLGRAKKYITISDQSVLAETNNELYLYSLVSHKLIQVTKTDCDKENMNVYLHK